MLVSVLYVSRPVLDVFLSKQSIGRRRRYCIRAELNYEWFSDTEETNKSFLSTNEAIGDQPTEDIQMTPPDVTNAPVTMGMLAELLRSLNAGNSNRGIQRKEVIKLPEFNSNRSE